MTSRRNLVRMLLAAAALAALRPAWLEPRQASAERPKAIPIGDGFVSLDGWILKADEAASVLA